MLRNNAEGWRFLTMWKEDKKHGRGVFVNACGLFVQCLFSFDQMLGEGLIYHENEMGESRVYVGNLATHMAENSR